MAKVEAKAGVDTVDTLDWVTVASDISKTERCLVNFFKEQGKTKNLDKLK